VEYLGFRDVSDHREYRLVVHGSAGATEVRFRIAIAAFGPGRVRLQDGPDVCYQKLLRALAAGEAPSPDLVTIHEGELASFHAAHTQTPKRRSWTTPSAPKPVSAQRPEPRPRLPQLPVAPFPRSESTSGLDEG